MVGEGVHVEEDRRRKVKEKHRRGRTKVRQKRHDCARRATGRAALFRESGRTGPRSVSPSLCVCVCVCVCACLDLHCCCPLCATASFVPPPPHTRTESHQERARHFISRGRLLLFAQTDSCSNIRCEQLVFRPGRGGRVGCSRGSKVVRWWRGWEGAATSHLCQSPRKETVAHLPKDEPADEPPPDVSMPKSFQWKRSRTPDA